MPLDSRITLATPEGVTIEMVLAGLGSRFVARLLDTLIQIALILTLSIGGFLANGSDWDGFLRAAVVTLSFVVLFFYDVPFETLGRDTPGKRAMGIRVVGANGERIDFVTSAVRNLMRIVDFIPLYLPGSVSIIATAHNQRLGDLAAGTLVVREKFGGRGGTFTPVAPITVPPAQVMGWDVSAVRDDEIIAVRHFLDRRLALPWPIRSYFASQLVQRLWPRVPGVPTDAHAEYILEGIVVAKQSRA